MHTLRDANIRYDLSTFCLCLELSFAFNTENEGNKKGIIATFHLFKSQVLPNFSNAVCFMLFMKAKYQTKCCTTPSDVAKKIVENGVSTLTGYNQLLESTHMDQKKYPNFSQLK